MGGHMPAFYYMVQSTGAFKVFPKCKKRMIYLAISPLKWYTKNRHIRRVVYTGDQSEALHLLYIKRVKHYEVKRRGYNR